MIRLCFFHCIKSWKFRVKFFSRNLSMFHEIFFSCKLLFSLVNFSCKFLSLVKFGFFFYIYDSNYIILRELLREREKKSTGERGWFFSFSQLPEQRASRVFHSSNFVIPHISMGYLPWMLWRSRHKLGVTTRFAREGKRRTLLNRNFIVPREKGEIQGLNVFCGLPSVQLPFSRIVW